MAHKGHAANKQKKVAANKKNVAVNKNIKSMHAH